jgi:uncharacterized protein (DUF1778 family)
MGKPGRPPTPEAEALSEIVPIRMTKAERAQCERAAELAGQKLSSWIRERLSKAAKRESKRD